MGQYRDQQRYCPTKNLLIPTMAKKRKLNAGKSYFFCTGCFANNKCTHTITTGILQAVGGSAQVQHNPVTSKIGRRISSRASQVLCTLFPVADARLIMKSLAPSRSPTMTTNRLSPNPRRIQLQNLPPSLGSFLLISCWRSAFHGPAMCD